MAPSLTDTHPSGSPNPQIKTRILILSDTHSALPNNLSTKHPFDHPFPQADVAVHCGDLTSTGKLQEHANAVTLLRSLPAPLKIVIPGNHDLTLDKTYCATHPLLYDWRQPHTSEDLAQARDMYTNKAATDAGILYMEEGTHTFRLPNGAEFTVYASPYTPEFRDWGFAYPRSVDRFNPSDNDKESPDAPVPRYKRADLAARDDGGVTIMVTHGPPKGVLDLTTRSEKVGCEHLMRAVERCRPLLHCFGHIHEGWGSEIREWSHDTQDEKGPQSNRGSGGSALAASVGGFVELSEGEKKNARYVDATGIKHGSQTVFVNASIMDVQYVPCQKPWIVDVLLPAALESGKNQSD